MWAQSSQEILKLADKKPTKLPSYGLLQQMLTEDRRVGLAQVGEIAEQASAGTSTLH